MDEHKREELIWLDKPALKRPIFILALEGWFDVAFGATSTVEWLQKILSARTVAEIDPDQFYDFTSRRPQARIDDLGEREIVWPENHITVASIPDGAHDLVLLSGIEPHLRWRHYVHHLLEVIEELHVELVVTLGANADPIPHTRTPIVLGSTTTPQLAQRLGLSAPSYQGVTGVFGVLHEALDNQRIPTISLRVPVSYYATSATNPRAVVALATQVERVTGIPTNANDLAGTVSEWAVRVDAAVQANDELSALLPQLEWQYDRHVESQMPPVEDMAAEVERFLRGLGDDGEVG